MTAIVARMRSWIGTALFLLGSAVGMVFTLMVYVGEAEGVFWPALRGSWAHPVSALWLMPLSVVIAYVSGAILFFLFGIVSIPYMALVACLVGKAPAKPRDPKITGPDEFGLYELRYHAGAAFPDEEVARMLALRGLSPDEVVAELERREIAALAIVRDDRPMTREEIEAARQILYIPEVGGFAQTVSRRG